MYMSARTIAIVFVALAVLSTGIILVSRQKIQRDEAQITPTPTPKPNAFVEPEKGGMLTLRDADRSAVFRKGERIPLTVIADSSQQPIVGYDVVIQFDPDTVIYREAVNRQDDFQLLPAAQKNRVILTGTKKLDIKAGTVFNSAILADLTFEATSEGPAAFSIVYEKGKTNDSNLMTETNEDILGKTQSDIIGVGETITLQKGIETPIDNGAATVTLMDAVKQAQPCVDCMDTADLQVMKDGKTEQATFRFGGIAGFMEADAEAFDYVFHVDNVASGSVRLSYYLK